MKLHELVPHEVIKGYGDKVILGSVALALPQPNCRASSSGWQRPNYFGPSNPARVFTVDECGIACIRPRFQGVEFHRDAHLGAVEL